MSGVDTVELATPAEDQMNIDLMFNEFVIQSNDSSPRHTLPVK